MPNVPMKTLTINGVVYEVVDETARQGAVLSNEIKQALLQIAEKVAYIDEHGQDYYDDLEAALYQKAVVSISAVFAQTGVTVYDTDSLDTLRQYLTVTATYDDLSTETINLYTLSGTLTEGTSTITVSFRGKTDTFIVSNVVHVLYRLSAPFVSDGANSIDTGVAWELNKQYSLAITFSISQFTQFAQATGATPSFIYGDTHGESSGYTAMGEQQITGGSSAGRYVWGSSFGYDAGKNFVDVNQTVKFLFTFDIGSSTYIRNWYIKNVTAGTSNNGTATNPVTVIKGHNIFLGKQETSGGSAGFKGTISDFTIYDRILTADEITAYMG